MNLKILSIFFIIFSLSSYSQDYYRIYFTDKGNQKLKFNNQLYKAILSDLDKKAIERRKINLKTENIIFEKDIPIYKIL